MTKHRLIEGYSMSPGQERAGGARVRSIPLSPRDGSGGRVSLSPQWLTFTDRDGRLAKFDARDARAVLNALTKLTQVADGDGDGSDRPGG